MLYFLTVWTGLLGVCLAIGFRVLSGVAPDIASGAASGVSSDIVLDADRGLRLGDRAIVAAWLGLVLLSISLLLVAIALPLSPMVGAGVVFAWLWVSFALRSVRRDVLAGVQALPLFAWVGYGVCAISIALFSTQPVTWIDTGLYHYGLIRWFSEYGVTPGLALINKQFGFMSAWFAIAAPLNPVWLNGRASGLMNGFVLLLLLLQTVLTGARILTHRARYSDWFLAGFSVCVLGLLTQTKLLSVIAVSASPDIPVVALIVVTAWSFLLFPSRENLDRKPNQIRDNSALIPLMLAVGAASMKLTALPLLVVSAGYCLFVHAFGWLRLWKISLLTLALWLPFLTSEILVSSCPLYPAKVLCFKLPWARPAETLAQLAAASHGWGNWYGNPPTGVNRTLWLIQQWVQSNASSQFSAVLIVLSVFAAFYLLLRRSLPPLSGRLWVFLTLAIVGIVFMLLKAPLFRFGMGYLLLLPMLCVSVGTSTSISMNSAVGRLTVGAFRWWGGLIFLRRLCSKRWMFLVALVSVLGAIALSSTTHEAAHEVISQQHFLPPPLPDVSVNTQRVNGIDYRLTEDNRGRCWAASLPCVNVIDPNVVLRHPDKGMGHGFRQR